MLLFQIICSATIKQAFSVYYYSSDYSFYPLFIYCAFSRNWASINEGLPSPHGVLSETRATATSKFFFRNQHSLMLLLATVIDFLIILIKKEVWVREKQAGKFRISG